jgi:hypothetical protein
VLFDDQRPVAQAHPVFGYTLPVLELWPIPHVGLTVRHPPPELSYSIRRQARFDGVHFWHWEIIESCYLTAGNKLTIASGNVFGCRGNALRDVKSAVRDYWAAALPWANVRQASAP